MLRWLTAGESHGPALVATLEGLPAEVEITTAVVAAALARRRLGYGRGARMAFEKDEVGFLGGVRHGRTLGGPVAVHIANTEWPKWERVMSPDPVDASELEGLARNTPLTRPRPGHADLVGMQKYGFDEARPVLERASARETAARVALGAVAAAFLGQACGIRLVSHTVAVGTAMAPAGSVPKPDDVSHLDEDPLRCLDPDASAAMVAEVDRAHADGDTLGGVVEVVGHGLPPGLGSHVHWDRRLDARLAAALMSIQAIKGGELGDGFELARTRGSAAHDAIVPSRTGPRRTPRRSGGTAGGRSTGEACRERAGGSADPRGGQGRQGDRRRIHQRGDRRGSEPAHASPDGVGDSAGARSRALTLSNGVGQGRRSATPRSPDRDRPCARGRRSRRALPPARVIACAPRSRVRNRTASSRTCSASS